MLILRFVIGGPAASGCDTEINATGAAGVAPQLAAVRRRV
jgi:hypothetical protein